MWNFVGRQNDIQGRYDSQDGNWIGIKFMDELHLGSQDNLPEDVLKKKGRNTYYFFHSFWTYRTHINANKDRKVLCTIDFILIHRYCIENLPE
jgi:hypothetical protein